MQAVASLPSSLIEVILKASTVPLERQLECLPQCLCAAAIQAAVPHIAECGWVMCCFCSSEAVNKLWPHLHAVPQMTYLSLYDTNLHEHSMQKFMKHLGSMTQLRRLDLESSGLGRQEEHLPTLLPVLGQLPRLEHLDLSQMTIINIEAVHTLAAGMSSLAQLKHFALNSITMPLEGHQQLIPSMACHLTCLELLELRSSGINRGSVHGFAVHLAKMSTLQHLRLDSSMLSEVAILSLGPGLAKLHCLEVLSLQCLVGSSYVACTTVSDFAQHLSHCTRLVTLDLSVNGWQDEDIVSLMQHLSRLTSLQRLFLSENSITDEGIQDTLHYFCTLTNLQMLSVYNSESEGPSVEALMPLVRRLPSLQEVSVNESALSEAEPAHEVFRGPCFEWDVWVSVDEE